MTLKELKKSKIGDKVRWESFEEGVVESVGGEVSEVGYAAVKIQWDDGKVAIIPFQQCNTEDFLANVSKVN